MKSLKEPLLLPVQNDPFFHCKLGRKKYASVLTNIVINYSDGFVLAINNKWGTGKSTFVKMWQEQIESTKQARTIYFNAWENDFEDNPLTAIMGELRIWSTKSKSGASFEQMLQSAASITKEIAPALAKAIAEKYLDTKILTEAVGSVTKGVSDIFVQEVKKYSNRKESIQQFRSKLEEFIEKENGNKPLVFIIDELDRCRPNYAVAILEQIKHFFSVKNIIFVLSIDKEQLGHAVRGVYGSERINAEEYLRRFIDIEYSLPDPIDGSYLDYLYDYYDLDTVFKSPFRSFNSDNNTDSESFKIASKMFFQNVQLRKQQKIISLTKVILMMFSPQDRILPKFLLFLIYVKTFHEDFYQQIRSKKVKLSDAHNHFKLIVEPFIDTVSHRHLIPIEAFFLNFYNNFLIGDDYGKTLYQYVHQEQKHILSVVSKIDTKMLEEFFSTLDRNDKLRHLKIDFYTNKIDLMDSFKADGV